MNSISYFQNVIFKDIISDATEQTPNTENISYSTQVEPDKREELFHKMCDFATKSLMRTFANLSSDGKENDTLNWSDDNATTNFSSSR